MHILNSDLIVMDLKADSAEEVIKYLGGLLYNKGFVKRTYTRAVLEREKIYPTGLPANSVKVAIPHTDSSHVYDSAIAIAVLNKPVKFMMMGGTGEELDVEIVFLLAVDDPAVQIKTLKKLMKLFQDEKLLDKLKNAESKEDIFLTTSETLS